MQYFFTKNHSNKQKNIRQYDVFRVISLESLTRDRLIKFSKVLDAKYVENLFSVDFSYCAIAYRSGSNSPWSSKTKDILDSCLSYTAYQIERFKLYELPKNKNKYNFDYDQMTEAFLPSLSDIKKYLNSKRKETFRFLHISTDEVFGSLEDTGNFDELSRYDPRSPYSASKASSDHLVNAWHHTYGLPVVITNCSNNYGPWQFPEKLIPCLLYTSPSPRD